MTGRRAIVAVAAVALLVGLLAGAALTRSGTSHTETTSGRDHPIAAPTPSAGESSAARDRTAPTEDGARSAAMAFASASQQWLYMTDQQIDDAIREIAAPEAADRISRETVAEIRVARDPLTESAGRIWWFVRPLATNVESVDATSARVSVWVVTVLSAADVALPQADWLTLNLDLVRSGDRWLLESIEDQPGPTPMSGVRDEPWQPEPFDDALDGFERVGSEVDR